MRWNATQTLLIEMGQDISGLTGDAKMRKRVGESGRNEVHDRNGEAARRPANEFCFKQRATIYTYKITYGMVSVCVCGRVYACDGIVENHCRRCRCSCYHRRLWLINRYLAMWCYHNRQKYTRKCYNIWTTQMKIRWRTIVTNVMKNLKRN